MVKHDQFNIKLTICRVDFQKNFLQKNSHGVIINDTFQINSFALKELVYGYSLPWYSYQDFLSPFRCHLY